MRGWTRGSPHCSSPDGGQLRVVALYRGRPREEGDARLLLTALLPWRLNLAVLGFFKYVGFFQSNLNRVLSLVGVDVLPVLSRPAGRDLVLHVQDHQLHRGHVSRPVPPARSLLDFACYVAFFPQLLSGPIQRYGTIDPSPSLCRPLQTNSSLAQHTLDKFSWGVALFMLGFAKKILLANAMGQVADAVFAAESPGTLDAWFGALAYSFQLYFDFSAYSEMAIGLGLMLGFECPRNFDAPYRAGRLQRLLATVAHLPVELAA